VLQQLLVLSAHPVLQYSDHTLIDLKAEESQLLALKDTLQAFLAAIGLHINFEKENSLFFRFVLTPILPPPLPHFLGAQSPSLSLILPNLFSPPN